MFELTYTSLATLANQTTRLIELAKTSKQTYSERDITGCLFYQAGMFIGILEGRKEVLEVCFDEIKHHASNRTVSLLAKGQIPERQFADWNLLLCSKENMNIAEYRLLMENLLALTELAEKRTHGSRVFWNAVREAIKEHELV